MKEIYKMVKIDEFPEYLISKCGKVYSTKSNKYLKNTINIDGYFIIRFKKNNTRIRRRLHRLLAIAFIDNPKLDEYNIIDHINNNKQDNRLENLRWCNNSINNRNQIILLKRNKTGIIGVNYDKIANSYRATWNDENKKTCVKVFSLNKYDNAKELAIEYRQKMVDKYYNRLN
tara:strand:+ start:210 stop:728 length:519 start_codon:yes stop_codon:yes gene_type:complete